MYDVFETVGSSQLQHGKSSDRVYLMKLSREDYPGIITTLSELAEEHGYGKIFAKIPAWAESEFNRAGYKREGFIPGFYNGSVDAIFMAYYPDPGRMKIAKETLAAIADNIALAEDKARKPQERTLPKEYTLRKLTPGDAEELTGVYKVVFDTYPFPIYEPDYIIETMEKDLIEYYGAFHGQRLVAASSSEMDTASENVEMTDFATLPDFLGNGLAVFLLDAMEEAMAERGMKTFYTIARSLSAGMNITFARKGFRYRGTLVNNTNISGSIEPMNIWYKHP